MSQRDDDALAAARATHATVPATRALLKGVGAQRPPWGAGKADSQLIDAVHRGARCHGEDGLTEARYQDDAQPWRAMCMLCPVRAACLAVGRKTWGWGVHGGVALVDGYVAAESAQAVAAVEATA